MKQTAFFLNMHEILERHRRFWQERRMRWSAFWGIAFWGVSMVFNHFASIYATVRASNSVTDLLLDNLPVFNVAFIVNEGAALFGLFIIILLLLQPKRIPFVLKASALFILIRSFFIIFTHLGPFPERSFMDPLDVFQAMSSGGDLFFSGHTGLPFLLALVFWRTKNIRNVCLFASIFFATSVILGHLHYSIDVFAAFFISYSIFALAREFFKKDYRLLNTDEVASEAAETPFANN